jgi:mRNA interferase MazF
MLRPGDVILAKIQFVDTNEVKTRPAVVLFEERDNVVVAGITSNLKMDGVPLRKSDGAIKDSVIKVNYIFTVSTAMVYKVLFSLSSRKKKEVFDALIKRLDPLDVV